MKKDWVRTWRRFTGLVPHMLASVVIASHASELVRVVSHASFTELGLAGVLLLAWVGTRSSQEEL